MISSQHYWRPATGTCSRRDPVSHKEPVPGLTGHAFEATLVVDCSTPALTTGNDTESVDAGYRFSITDQLASSRKYAEDRGWHAWLSSWTSTSQPSERLRRSQRTIG